MTNRRAQLRALQKELQQDYLRVSEAYRCVILINDMETFGFVAPAYTNGMPYLSLSTIYDCLWYSATIRLAEALNVSKVNGIDLPSPRFLECLQKIPNKTQGQQQKALNFALFMSQMHAQAIAVKSLRDWLSAHLDFSKEELQIQIRESLTLSQLSHLCGALRVTIQGIWSEFDFEGSLKGIDEEFFNQESRRVLGGLSRAFPIPQEVQQPSFP